jgi:hypothetical protein
MSLKFDGTDGFVAAAAKDAKCAKVGWEADDF